MESLIVFTKQEAQPRQTSPSRKQVRAIMKYNVQGLGVYRLRSLRFGLLNSAGLRQGHVLESNNQWPITIPMDWTVCCHKAEACRRAVHKA